MSGGHTLRRSVAYLVSREASNEALQQTRSALSTIAAALAAERRCSTGTSTLADNGGALLFRCERSNGARTW